MSVIAAVLIASSEDALDGTPIPLLPWPGGDTLIEYEIAQLQAAGVEVIEVVLGREADRIIRLVARDDVEPIIDPGWRPGSASSLRVGTSAVPRDTTTALIASVDEPRPAAVYRALLEQHEARNATITLPTFEGTPGAPIVVARAALGEIRNLHADAGGLGSVLRRHAREVVKVAYESDVVLLRIDTPAAYARAREILGFS